MCVDHKNDEHKCSIRSKTKTPNEMLTFVVGSYIRHQDSNFYACLDKDQPFANLEDDIAYFKSKGEVIVFGDMNARTRNFQLDSQESFMPHISRMQEDMQMYSRSSSDEKDPDQFGKLLLQMCNSTGLLIANGVSFWPNTNGFTCRKHNGNSVIDYVLLSEGILDRIHKFSLGEWTPESDHRALCIDLKCMHRFDCEKVIDDDKQPHLSMNLKRAPKYSKMVEDMLQMTKIQHGATLECKWEVFKKVILSCTNKCFSTNHTSWKCTKKFRKKWFDKECREARKCLMVLDVVKDK